MLESLKLNIDLDQKTLGIPYNKGKG